MVSEWYRIRSTDGPTLVYGAETRSKLCSPSAAYQLDRFNRLICISKPTSAAWDWNCSNRDCSAGTDWLVETGMTISRRSPSFIRTSSSSRSVQPASSNSSLACSTFWVNKDSSEYPSGSTEDSNECDRGAVSKYSASIPPSTSTDRMKASRTRTSSNGAWDEFSSSRFAAPGRGESRWPMLASSADWIVSGWALSMTSTSPDCSAAYRVAASGIIRQVMPSRYA